MNHKLSIVKHFVILLLLFIALPIRADQTTQLSKFSKMDMSNGLGDDRVATLSQLPDGTIFVRHDSCVSVLKDGEIKVTPIPYDYTLRNSIHQWARTTRFDTDNNVWIKEPNRVWCFNVTENRFINLSTQTYNDVFVDESHHLWLLEDSVLTSRQNGKDYTIDIRGKSKTLQAVDSEDDRLYTFYNDGELLCYSLTSGQLLYRKRPYTEDEADNYGNSFTTHKGPDGSYYVLHHNYSKCIFLCFNPKEEEWRTIFETTNGHGLHCIEQPTADLAVIGCSTGIWIIDINTGKMELCTSIPLTDGTEINTGVNAVLQTADGRFLIGTYGQGLLTADSLFAPASYTLQIIICILAFLLFINTVAVLYYRHIVKKRSSALMQRIQDLVRQNNEPVVQSAIKEEEETQQISELSERDREILKQATALVNKNISQQGYNVDDLARDMAMERTGLYRHLNRIIQQSPSAFIRGIRMERALELVGKPELTITDVSEQLGFSSVSYFSKCFKEYYGYSPSEYKESI